MIRNFIRSEPAVIKFEAGRATFAGGYNLIQMIKPELDEKDHDVFEVLRSFLQPHRQTISLYLREAFTRAQRNMSNLTWIGRTLIGNSAPLLPSMSTVEYAAFGSNIDHIISELGCMHRPHQLLAATAPLLMVPYRCGRTFSTIKDAAVHIAYSATVANAESNEALRLWSDTRHTGNLFLTEKSGVIGVHFRSFERLGNNKHELQFRLPRDIACVLDVLCLVTGRSEKLKGYLMGSNPGLPRHDAFFEITSHSFETLMDLFKTDNSRKMLSVKCHPHYNCFTYGAQLATVVQLQSARNKRWHDILLNQVYDDLKSIHLTEGIIPERERYVTQKLRSWVNWNPEQLRVIDSIHSVKGGMSIIMGPAATGKTLLQRGRAI